MRTRVCSIKTTIHIRDRPRFFDQVGHQTTNASKYYQTYQNYEQPCQRSQSFKVIFMCPIFVSSVHNFGKSYDGII